MDRNSSIVAAAIVFSAIFAKGATIKDGMSDWTYAGSYVGGDKPSAAGSVLIPAGATVTLDAADSASWNFAGSLSRIIPEASDSVLVVNVPAGSTNTLSVAFSAANGDIGGDIGVLRKTGGGVLQLGADGVYKTPSGNKCDYYTAFDIREGMVMLPQNVRTAGNYLYGHVNIEANAAVYTITLAPDAGYIYPNMWVNSVSGEGSVDGGSERTFQVKGSGESSSVFAGRITGAAVWMQPGHVKLTSVDSDTTRPFSVFNNFGAIDGVNAPGVAEVVKFGNAGEPSSVGSAARIETSINGGGYVYLGGGETTDKELRLRDTVASPGLAFIDGGANGGLVWAGDWTQNAYYADETQTRRIVLTGSNRVECVMAGAFNDTPQGGVKYPIYVIKRGIGVWRMADNANRGCGGGYAIEEGVLKYDSLAERGIVCSLGTATNLTENYTGQNIESHRADYAILLGSDKEGTMEFTGSSGAECSTRPIAVKNRGRFKVSGDGDFRFAGISAFAGEALLKLDTDRADGVVISDLADGGGRLSVEKTGTGTVELDGELSFSGALKVSEGRLVVKGLRREPFTYFRWTLKEKAYNSARYKDAGFEDSQPLAMAMQEFALFDSSGLRINGDLAENRACADNPDLLGPGQATIVGTSWPTVTGKLGELYDSVQWKSGQDWNGMYISAKAWPGFVLSNPTSWMQIVERLPENAGAVASYDLAYSFGTEGVKGGFGITAFSLEGSVDGKNWNLIAERTDCEIPSAQFRWLSSPDSDANRHLAMSDGNNVVFFDDHAGFAVDGGITKGRADALGNVAGVSVAAGAVLECVGGVTVSGLTLDASGNGTISGLEFAADGILKIVNASQGAMAPTGNFAGCKGLDNLKNWTLEVDGKIRRGWQISVSETGEIKVVPPGMFILVR